LSEQGAQLAAALAGRLEDSRVFVHNAVAALPDAQRFGRIADLTGKLFGSCRNLVYIAPTGLVVRAIAPCIRSKLSDPAVVVVDVGGRWAISLLSGHEGGANELAMAVSNILASECVVTTTTEALKTIIVGVGCRRGVGAESIVAAIGQALSAGGAKLEQVRLIASADIKADEPGLLAAAEQLNVPLKFISSDEIRRTARAFTRSKFVQSKVRLPAVAEPSALLAGRRTWLLLPKQIYGNVTVALAAENSLWSE
jgi:cobalt-precorrin 5A hydrolase